MYRFIIASLAFMWIGTSHAMIINDFTGQYSADNWNITEETGDGGITVDHSDPTILDFHIRGTSAPRHFSSSTLTYEVVATESGTISFDWITGGFFLESPAPDLVIEFLGVLSIPPSDTVIAGALDSLQGETGHTDLSIKAGQSFGIKISQFGVGQPDNYNFRITGFSAPVTEPGILLLMGLGLIGLVAQRRKA